MMAILERLIQKRSGVTRPNQWLVDWVSGGTVNASGVVVNPSTAVSYAAYGECIRIISETVAFLPFHNYVHLSPKGKERKPGEVDTLISRRPNRFMSPGVFWQAIISHAASGNGYAAIVRDKRKPDGAELWPLDSTRMSVVWDEERHHKSYVYTRPTKSPKTFGDSEILHIPGFGFDGLQGFAPAKVYAETLGIGMAGSKHTAAFLGNATKPSGVLEHPGELTSRASANLQKSFDRKSGGPEKAGQTLVLEEGMTWKPISMTNDEAELIALLRWGVEEVARIFRMPVHKLQLATESGRKANVEEENREFVQDVILPWTAKVAQECNRKLVVNPDEFCAHTIEALLKADVEKRYGAYAVGRQNGFLTGNEIRDKEDLNPLPGGDVLLVPMNLTTPDRIAAGENMGQTKGVQNTAGEEGDRNDDASRAVQRAVGEAFRPAFEDAYARLARVEADKIGRARKREKDIVGLWLNEFSQEHTSYVRSTLFPLLEGCCNGIVAAGAAEGDEGWLDEYVAGAVARHLHWVRLGAEVVDPQSFNEHFGASDAQATKELRSLIAFFG